MIAILSSLSIILFHVALAAAALSDVRRFLIPNWTSLLLIAGFAAAAPIAGLSMSAVESHIILGLGAFAVMFALFAMGFLGGGDAKLFAAAALWMDKPGLATFGLWMVSFGLALSGVMAIIYLVVGHMRRRPRFANNRIVRQLAVRGRKRHVPYGLAIALGAVAAFPITDLFDGLLANLFSGMSSYFAY